MLGSEGGWIVMSHIGWGEEQTTIYKGVKTFPSRSNLEIEKQMTMPMNIYNIISQYINKKLYI